LPDALSDLRAAFPVAARWIYFNHAAVAPVALPVEQAVAEFLREGREHGSAGFAGWLARREAARAAAAKLLGAQTSEVAFTTCTSQGLITVAEGLRLRPGDEIVCLQDDFPANRIPWWRQVRRGARIVEVPRDAAGRITPEAVLARVGPLTRLVAVSSVLYDRGFRLDLPALGAALAARNAAAAAEGRGACETLLCVDAIQSLGALPLDVEQCRIDFLSADSHKWLLGLEGIGLFYCRASRLEELDGPLVSWWSYAQPFAPWTPAAKLQPDARRFEYSVLPVAELYGFDAALRLLAAAGLPAVERRVLELTDRLGAGLLARGWELLSPRERAAERSGIVTARHPSRPAREVLERLVAAGVQLTERGGGVRFSPHGWNTAEEVDRLLERLP
jgi:cysteine desulfurase / selenocysteine lyase